MQQRSPWVLRAALVAIVFAVYLNSFGLGLVEDSAVIVGQDARIRAVTTENLRLIFAEDYWWPLSADLIYRPLTTLSFLVNYAVLGNGPAPAGYHWTNFLLHALNACLVFELARRLLPSRDRQGAVPAFFAAALWAVHPIATEAVDNVVGRADLLATAAVLGALLLYWRGAAPAALAAVATLGYFAKENSAVLPGLMLLTDIAFTRAEPLRRRLWSYAAVIVPLGALLAARAAVFSGLPWPKTVYLDNVLAGAGFWESRFTAVKVIGHYLWLLLFPIPLASDRSYAEVTPAGWSDVYAWVSLVLVTGAIAAAVGRRRTHPLAFWVAGFFGIALLPVSNLLFPIRSAMAERFLYLPSVAFAIAVAAFAWRRLAPRTATAAMAVLLVLYGVRTFARNAEWESNLTLAAADVQTAGRSVRLRDLLAKSLFEQDAQRNIDRAIAEQETAWDLLKPLPDARSADLPVANLGIYYATKASLVPPAQSRPWLEKSVAVLERARAISQAAERVFDEAQRARGKPPGPRQGYPILYLYLGNDFLQLGRYSEALDAFRYARTLKPHMPEIYDGMALAYQGLGQADGASIAQLEKALVEGSPRPANVSQRQYDEAWADLTEAFRQAREPLTR